jgi:hypothetical protein
VAAAATTGGRRGGGGSKEAQQRRRPIPALRLLDLMELGLIADEGPGGWAAEEDPAELAAARRVWACLHAGLSRLLSCDAYAAAAAAALRGAAEGKGGAAAAAAEAREGAPQVDAATWPEAARRYLWGVAASNYLSTIEAPPARGAAAAAAAAAAAPPPVLPGRLSSLGGPYWAAALCGGAAGGSGLGPVPRSALLPRGASENAAPTAEAADDAAALTAAAALVRRLAEQRAAADTAAAAAGDPAQQPAAAAAAPPPAALTDGLVPGPLPDDPAIQQRRLDGRRLLQALMPCRADKGAGAATGRSMCFFAAELGALARWHKALDLRVVAARLESGLYDGSDGMEVGFDCLFVRRLYI